MEKKELKKQLDEVVLQIKNNSKDAKFAEALIDKMLSLKGQIDVEPTRIHIPEKDVIKEYDCDAFRFIRCKTCIIMQDKGGMSIVVKPTMTSLYAHLTVVLDMKDRYEELTDDEKKVYEALFSATTYIMNALVCATIDDELFFGIAHDIIHRFDDYVKSKEKELQEETPQENAEFENMNNVLMGEQNDRTVG